MAEGQSHFSNPVFAGATGEDHGDPFILRYLDEYFLYHTGNTTGRKPISVYRSKDLVNWKFEGYCLYPSDDDEAWNWTDLWAPEVWHVDGTFYMYPSVTCKRRGREKAYDEYGEGDHLKRRIGVARADNPLGPFVWDPEPLRSDFYTIDGHPFRDTDGADYLFYVKRGPDIRHADGTYGVATFCERLENYENLIGPPVSVAFPSEPWEAATSVAWYVNEGPFVVKRRGRYFQLYSGGFYQEQGYGAGIAYADDMAGPWLKWPDNPIWKSKGRLLGPGHFALILAPDGATIYVVYHAYVMEDEAAANSPERLAELHWKDGRKVLLDRFYWRGDRPILAGPTAEEQVVPPQPVYDAGVPYWRAEVWVKGEELEVGESSFALNGPSAYRQLHLTQGSDQCTVVERGALLGTLPGLHRPDFSGDNTIDAVTVTSFFEDDRIHELRAGDTVAWKWGGSGAFELNVAVKGSVELSVGDEVHRWPGSGDEYRLEILHRSDGTETVTIKALTDATVTDLCLYAR